MSGPNSPPLQTESTVDYSLDLLSVAERETMYALILKAKQLEAQEKEKPDETTDR